jgi:hypothetical protein
MYTDDLRPPPKKSRTGLVRSYAMALIPDTRRAVKGDVDGYEPDTEQEMASDTEKENEEDQTPKKKKKGKKPKVRELIEVQRDDLASKAPEDMEVSVYHLNPT